jgi:glycopeptide antibiotics resistance protein
MALFPRLSGKANAICIAINVVILLMVGLWPYTFHFAGNTASSLVSTQTVQQMAGPGYGIGHKSFLSLSEKIADPLGYFNGRDYILNIFGFIPLGFFLGNFLRKYKGRKGWVRSLQIAVFLVPAGLSLSIEFLQLYLPIRTSELSDLLLNSAGGIIGILLVK